MQTPGLIVAPLTPFTADLKVDEASLQRQIDYIIRDCSATMLVAAGTVLAAAPTLAVPGQALAAPAAPTSVLRASANDKHARNVSNSRCKSNSKCSKHSIVCAPAPPRSKPQLHAPRPHHSPR